MDLALSGRRVLITGGSSGIGAATARAFAEEGARVAINYHEDAQEAERLCAALAGLAAEPVFALQGDVGIAEDVERMFASLDDRWNGLDILVNNAGIDGRRACTWEARPADWDAVLDVNLKGSFLCARAALQRMVPARRGVVVNISSVHEIIAWGGHGAYAASKAGLSMMAKTLALEAAPFGIRVLSVAPGAIRTDINAAVWQDERGHADLVGKIPLARMGEPTEVARMIAVLASDVGSYVTGTTIFVDGGMTDYPAFAKGG
jgi:NAD(P)-dependent dehydrogenase (short-subunit alcohol dehydrogenase family)